MFLFVNNLSTKPSFFLKLAIYCLLIFFYLFVGNSFAGEKNSDFSHGISIFGDLKYPQNFTHFDYVNPSAPKNGQIKYGVEGTFNSLNPFILKGIPASGMNMNFDTLMIRSADEVSSKYGLIAKSAKISKDKKSLTFLLRKIARFHDGSKISADDVVFSFNILKEKGHPSFAMVYRDVAEVKKIGDYEVKFIFKNGKNRELPLSVASLPIFSKNYYSISKNPVFDKTTFEVPLGSGAYKVLDIYAGKSITYQRVENYWARDLPVNRGRHNFDKITYEYYRDNNVLVEAFKAGEYDFRQENISRNWANSYNIDKVKNGQIIKKEIDHNLPAPMQSFVFNLRKEKFQNLILRKAIALSFDFEWVREKIFYGSYARNSSFFGNSEFGSSGLPSPEELKILDNFQGQIPESVFNDEFKLPKSDGSGFSRKTLIEARDLLESAGYFVKDKKLIDPKTNQPVEFEFLINSKSFQMVISPMIKNLKILGIKAGIRLVDENQYLNRLKDYDYDVIVNVFGSSTAPGDEQFSYWHSSQKDIVGGNNLAGVENEAVDYLVEKISTSKNKNELKVFTKSLDRILLNSFYVIPQWHSSVYRILYQNKFAMPANSPPYSLALDSWWVR
ncbi:MAG: microcin C transport system substrate-binding protein [Rickettsiales bacterium]|jgi:microcin C transport system substrate-binding protein